MTILLSAAPREVHSGRRAGPPYPLLGYVACEVCGLAAVAFWPGHHVQHDDKTVCLIATGKRLSHRPANGERVVL